MITSLPEEGLTLRHWNPSDLVGRQCLLMQSKHVLEKNFQTQSISEGSDFIKNKEQRQCGHSDLPTNQGDSTVFMG